MRIMSDAKIYWTPDRVKELRLMYGDDREQFATRTRTDYETVRSWESPSGKRSKPSGPATYTLDDLADRIGYPPSSQWPHGAERMAAAS